MIRTCGLYGLHGAGGKKGNFIETMLRLGREGKPIRVVDDQRCTPSYTLDVAATLVSLIAKKAQGLFHVTNSGSCTWYQLAKHVLRIGSSHRQPDGDPVQRLSDSSPATCLQRAVARCPDQVRRGDAEAVAGGGKSLLGDSWRVKGGG